MSQSLSEPKVSGHAWRPQLDFAQQALPGVSAASCGVHVDVQTLFACTVCSSRLVLLHPGRQPEGAGLQPCFARVSFKLVLSVLVSFSHRLNKQELHQLDHNVAVSCTSQAVDTVQAELALDPP